MKTTLEERTKYLANLLPLGIGIVLVAIGLLGERLPVGKVTLQQYHVPLLLIGIALLVLGALVAIPFLQEERLGKLLVLGAGTVCVLMVVREFWVFTIDDAFISMRYARNLADGHGLVWNVGEAPVEGYTNFLWVLLLALGHVVRLPDPLLPGKLIAALCAVGILALVQEMADEFYKCSRITSAVVVFLVALTPIVALHIDSGLETVPFAFFVLLVAYLAARRLAAPDSKWLAIGFAVAGLIASLIRPEGVLVTGVAFLFMEWHALRVSTERRAALELAVWFVIFYLLPAAVYMGWRWIYFGSLFPNTYYVKVGGGLDGIEGVIGFLVWLGVILGLALVGLVVERNRVSRLLLVISAALLVFYTTSSLILNYNQRLFFEIFPLAVLLGVPAVEKLRRIAWASDERARYDGLQRSVAALTLVGCLFLTLQDWMPVRDFVVQYGMALESVHFQLGRTLANFPGGTVAVADAGAIPYFSQWRAIDYGALNDVYLAHAVHDGTYDAVMARYVYAHTPDVLVLVSKTGGHFALGDSGISHSSGLLRQMREFRCFVPVGAKPFGTDGTNEVVVYVNSQWQSREPLQAQLRTVGFEPFSDELAGSCGASS